jgi:hypothetical protein
VIYVEAGEEKEVLACIIVLTIQKQLEHTKRPPNCTVTMYSTATSFLCWLPTWLRLLDNIDKDLRKCLLVRVKAKKTAASKRTGAAGKPILNVFFFAPLDGYGLGLAA